MNDPENLRSLKPAMKFFVGIDSDGCVFDGMERKHRECFAPMFIAHFRLEAADTCAREAWDFVNLRSKTRGANRFQALALALKLLRERREVAALGVAVPGTVELEAWIASPGSLSNATLQREVEAGNRALEPVLAWSQAVNQAVENLDGGVPPFPFVRECLQKMVRHADVVVVSHAPTETLAREWREHGIARHARILAGQELGAKADHIRLAAGGRYPADHILMIGDAPGDLQAARSNQALFYPILPGREGASWEMLLKEVFDLFLSGAYAGAREAMLIREFDASLPEKPDW